MKIKNELPLKLNIQFFAEPETDPPGDSGGKEPDNETLTLTAEELQKRIESESDKKLDKVLQKEREKRDAEIEKRVQKALEDDKRLSQLSDAERQAEELTQREQDLINRENKIRLSEIKSDAINELSTRKVDTRFVDYLLTDDADATFENIKNFNELLDEAINEAVKASTRQEAPRNGGYKLGDKRTSDQSTVELARSKRIIK